MNSSNITVDAENNRIEEDILFQEIDNDQNDLITADEVSKVCAS